MNMFFFLENPIIKRLLNLSDRRDRSAVFVAVPYFVIEVSMLQYPVSLNQFPFCLCKRVAYFGNVYILKAWSFI